MSATTTSSASRSTRELSRHPALSVARGWMAAIWLSVERTKQTNLVHDLEYIPYCAIYHLKLVCFLTVRGSHTFTSYRRGANDKDINTEERMKQRLKTRAEDFSRKWKLLRWWRGDGKNRGGKR